MMEDRVIGAFFLLLCIIISITIYTLLNIVYILIIIILSFFFFFFEIEDFEILLVFFPLLPSTTCSSIRISSLFFIMINDNWPLSFKLFSIESASCCTILIEVINGRIIINKSHHQQVVCDCNTNIVVKLCCLLGGCLKFILILIYFCDD